METKVEEIKSPGMKDLFKNRIEKKTVSPPKEGDESSTSDGRELNEMNEKITQIEQKLASSKSLTESDVAKAVRDAAKVPSEKVDYKDVDDFEDFQKKFRADIKSDIATSAKQSEDDQKASLAAMKQNMELARTIDAGFAREYEILKAFNPDGYDTYKPAIDAIRKDYPAIADFMGPIDLHSVLVGRELIDEFLASRNTPKTGVKPKEKDDVPSSDVTDVTATSLDAAVKAGMRQASEAHKGK